jgi:RNA polymerase-binding transcription factor DksA
MADELPWQSSTGQSSTGQSSTGQSSTGQSSTGQSSTGQSSTWRDTTRAPTAGAPERTVSAPEAEEYRNLLAAAAQILDGVDRALGQLADGSYGRCTECGAPIPDHTLQADPTAQRCPPHSSGDTA